MDRECPFVRPAGEERLGIKWSRAVSHRRPLNVQVVAASVLLVVNPDVMEARVEPKRSGFRMETGLAASLQHQRAIDPWRPPRLEWACWFDRRMRCCCRRCWSRCRSAQPLSDCSCSVGAPFAVFNSTYNYFTYGEMFNNGYGGSLQLGSS